MVAASDLSAKVSRMLAMGRARRHFPLIGALAAAVGGALWPVAAEAQAAPGFTFCPAPEPPACVAAPKAAPACDAEVEAYVARVFRYRECLARETERAVAQSNDVIDGWRCRRFNERCRR
jgi:hypothetical protein